VCNYVIDQTFYLKFGYLELMIQLSKNFIYFKTHTSLFYYCLQLQIKFYFLNFSMKFEKLRKIIFIFTDLYFTILLNQSFTVFAIDIRGSRNLLARLSVASKKKRWMSKIEIGFWQAESNRLYIVTTIQSDQESDPLSKRIESSMR